MRNRAVVRFDFGTRPWGFHPGDFVRVRNEVWMVASTGAAHIWAFRWRGTGLPRRLP